MPINAARAFNRLCPPGTIVEVRLRDDDARSGKLRAPAFVWSRMALVEVDGLPSYWTVDAVRPKLLALPEPKNE